MIEFKFSKGAKRILRSWLTCSRHDRTFLINELSISICKDMSNRNISEGTYKLRKAYIKWQVTKLERLLL